MFVLILPIIMLLLHVPYLLMLDDTVPLHFSYRIPVHSLISAYQLSLGQPLSLFPSMYPSNNVLYVLTSHIKCPKCLSFFALSILTSVRFSFTLQSTSSLIFSIHENSATFLTTKSRMLQGGSQVLLLQSLVMLEPGYHVFIL